jgi:hypothetical protein
VQSCGTKIGLVVVAVAGLGVTLLWEAPRISARWDWRDLVGSRQQKPVIVVVVGNLPKLADVRAVVTPAEILEESKGAFALQRRHVIAASFEDVGPLLKKVGWQEAPIEILAPAREATSPPLAALSSDRDFAGLAEKPRLSELEAHRLLDLME